jgi:SAM-dependent methyltransferase
MISCSAIDIEHRTTYTVRMTHTVRSFDDAQAWNAAAPGWDEQWSGFAAPARKEVAAAAEIAAGMSVLDVGCGSGEFVALAAARGARLSGLDASEGMIALARRKVLTADFRLGSIDRLPWPDEAFDVVTGFNAFQFAADVIGALSEARRVTHSGGRVAICNWGRLADREIQAIFEPLSALDPRPFDPPRTGEPGVLEALAEQAGLILEQAGEVDVPYAFRDRATLERAMVALAPIYGIAPDVAEPVVRDVVATDARPFRRADGSYRFENRFRYLITTVP